MFNWIKLKWNNNSKCNRRMIRVCEDAPYINQWHRYEQMLTHIQHIFSFSFSGFEGNKLYCISYRSFNKRQFNKEALQKSGCIQHRIAVLWIIRAFSRSNIFTMCIHYVTKSYDHRSVITFKVLQNLHCHKSDFCAHTILWYAFGNRKWATYA